MAKKTKYTAFEVADYVTGFLINKSWHDKIEISAAISNSLAMLNDDQDGIDAVFNRRARKQLED